MSVADHEIEPFDKWLSWCGMHELSYIRTCEQCANDEADRQYDSKKEREI